MTSKALYSRLSLAVLMLTATLATTAAEIPVVKPESVGMSTERLERVRNAVHRDVDNGRTPGVVTLIARHGKIVYLDAYGAADLGSGRKTRDDDIFRMYSMTKPITSVALLILYEEGKFQLTDPLSKYFPEFAQVQVYVGQNEEGMMLDAPRRAVTIQDVFRHTAGFSYGLGGATPAEAVWQEANLLSTDLAGFMDKLVTLPLHHQPGEKWVYSVSHDVQAALVERLSGMKFDQFVQQRILTPLGMKDTFFALPPEQADRMPTLYMAEEGKLVAAVGPMTENYGSVVFGGHSLSGTATDYLRFAQMLLNKGELDGVRVLGSKTVELMTSNHLPPSVMSGGGFGLSAGTGYGLGVSVLLDPVRRGNLGSAGEFGWSGAASTHFLVDPEEELIAIYCTQLMGGDFALRAEFVTNVYQAIIGD